MFIQLDITGTVYIIYIYNRLIEVFRSICESRAVRKLMWTERDFDANLKKIIYPHSLPYHFPLIYLHRFILYV